MRYTFIPAATDIVLSKTGGTSPVRCKDRGVPQPWIICSTRCGTHFFLRYRHGVIYNTGTSPLSDAKSGALPPIVDHMQYQMRCTFLPAQPALCYTTQMVSAPVRCNAGALPQRWIICSTRCGAHFFLRYRHCVIYNTGGTSPCPMQARSASTTVGSYVVPDAARISSCASSGGIPAR